MNGRQWYQARLRWAVMEEGRGLDHWREAEHIFQSDSREAAFEEALLIWRSQEYVITPDRPAAPVSSIGWQRSYTWRSTGRRRRGSRFR